MDHLDDNNPHSPLDRGKPLIAVSGGDQRAQWGAWDERATLVPTAYLLAVQAAGGVPVIVAASADPRAVARRIDGLLLTGGGDLDPHRYGEDPHPRTQAPDVDRDIFEAALLEACCDQGVPVLAVCRGLQVLNVARGGSLFQHLPDQVGTSEHQPTLGSFGRHWVRIGSGTRLVEVLGRDRIEVPTHHHQAVDRIGSGLVPTAWADDEIVEAVEDPDVDFLVGVQWHPEVGEDPTLFDAFVAAAAK